MVTYYRKVLDLYKDAITNHQVNSEMILDVKKEIACAITAARIKGEETESLLELNNDVQFIENTLI
jgi:hypothetical protein|nr:MAG TPA: hypothetical protein [Caudoviricetes sp.]